VGAYLIQGERYLYVNPKLADILGYTVRELLAFESLESVVAPDDRAIVLAQVRNAARGAPPEAPYTFRAIRKGGDQIEVEVYESPTESDGQPAIVGTLLDITERRRAEAQISERAFIDPLTKLPNRIRFMERLVLELAQSRRHDRRLAIVYMDVDGFKFVNDNWGHGVGDRLLQSLALRLKRGVREVDTVARIGGDQFLILVPDLRQSEDIGRVAQKLLLHASRPFEIDQGRLEVTASAGVAIFPEDGRDAETLLRNADTAMHRAKELGTNTFQLCTPELTATAIERLSLQNGLRLALERNELLLHFQPLVSIVSGRIVGFEALVRWQHPEKGLVMPATFIPVAEETGIILPLGERVLRNACARLKAWHGTGLDLRISVNFSARQFRERSLVHTVERALTEAGLEPRHLEIEITESIAMEGAEIVSANLNLLRSMGVGIAIDDFGTGYSSMSYLKSFPVTSLKIDRSFVTDLAINPADAGIVRAIVEMAHGSNLTVIAEGVETQEQFQRLQRYGCDEMQGYWFSRPLTEEGVGRRLEEEVQLWTPRA
jgi:diguanylate cyclase (GGDEF)-like protein/PAS domain S-box-containing protein